MPNPILDKITVNDIEYDLVGNGGGHVIEKSDGTDMTQRSNLQFVDAQLTDDSTNDRTKVENVKIIQNESELANLPDGIYMGAQDEAIPFSFEAEDISYDNTTSQLTATDVQAAIDELSQKEAGVQSDWNEADNTKLDYIKNKPANLVQDASYVHTDNNYTSTEKTKLGTIAEGAEVNVQSDWSQTDNTADDYIKNKPTIPDAQIQSDWNQTSGTAKDFIKNKPTLGTASALDVATSGDASSTQVVKGDDSRLSDARTPVAHNHTVSEITDFPALGTASALDVATSGDASLTQVVKGDDSRLSDARTPVSHTHTLSEITDAGSAASKNSTSSVTADSTDLVESGAVKTAIDNAISGAYKHAGTKTCAELISNLLIPINNGNVYNITDSGTTTADFIEGAGIPIRAGDNVGIAKISDSIYKFDLLSGFIDTSNFVNKSSTSGLIKNDGSIDTTEYAPASSVPAAQIQSDWSQSDNTKLDYIKNKPTLGTASAKNIPTSGNASASEVVMGNDSRLTDARNAADVYSWAKAENKPSYTKLEVGLGNVDNTSDATKKSNFTGSIASGNTGFVTGGDVYSALGDKVDKVEGKGLSTNDYTTTEKDKLAGIASGAEVNVQSDWSQTTTTADDYIKNKPANLVQDASYVHTDNNYTSDEKTKLSGIAAGAEVNVQSDWDETDDTQDDYIKNKPEAYDAIWQNNNILEGISDKQPYLYRATSKPEGAIEYVQEKLIGASAAVNQFVQNGNFADGTNNWALINGASCNVSNNEATIVVSSIDGRIQQNNSAINGHKYLVFASIYNPGSINIYAYFDGTRITWGTNTAYTTKYAIFNYSGTTGSKSISFRLESAPSSDYTYKVKNVNLIDLTQMFGTAIADLAYSKEQASAGSGIAWLKSYGFFIKDYYPYNTGALQSVKTGSKKVVGKNLVDDSIKYFFSNQVTIGANSNRGKSAHIIPGNYIVSTTLTSDTSGKIYVGEYIEGQIASAFINGNAPSLSFSVDKEMDITIWIYGDNVTSADKVVNVQLALGSTTTDYEPYTSTTYPLDSDLELRGLYKLDTNNNIVCDGDEYTPDGSVKRRYGIADLGTLSWGYYEQGARLQASVPDRKYDQNRYKGLANWSYSFYNSHPNNMSDGNYTFSNSDTQIYVRDSTYANAAAAFKTAMSGVYLIYELATSTTDTAASYQNPQIIHENGTEEFIDTRDYPLPVGHDTGYFTASDEKFFLPPVVDNDGRFLYHDGDGFQFKNFNQVASKVEESDINGNIKIDGTETQVYDDSELQGIVDTDTTIATGNPLNLSTKSAQNAVNTDIVIDPVQDLHGFTKPWVGGAGVQLVDLSEARPDSSTLIDFTYINGDLQITANAEIPEGYYASKRFDASFLIGKTFYVKQTITASDSDTGYLQITYDLNGTTNYVEIGRNPALSTTFSVPSGVTNVILRAYLKNGSAAISANAWAKWSKIMFSVTQNPDWSPYENICPISPKEQITVKGCGKNLAKPINDNADVNGIKYANQADGKLKVSGTANTYSYSESNSFTLKSGSYMISKNKSDGNRTSLTIRYTSDGTAIAEVLGSEVVSFTLTSDTEVKIRVAVPSGKVVDSVLEPMVRPASDADSNFEPYTPSNNLQIPLPNDFYGGTLNLESGELVVNKAIKSGKISGINTSYSNLEYGIFAKADDSADKGNYDYHDDISTMFPFIDASSDWDNVNKIGKAYAGASVTYYWIGFSKGTTLEEMQTITNNNVICYELVTPYTLHLTPHQLNLLKATNNISTDAKTISVTYRNGELSTYAPATDIADGLLTATDKRAIDRTSDIVEGNPIQFSTESKQIARSTIIDLEPIQDLHGFSKPWVGGAGKNLLPLTVDSIKAANTSGTWSGNAYTINNVTFTILTDSDNNIVGINANGTANATTVFRLIDTQTSPFTSNMIFNGCPSGGSITSYYMYFYDQTSDASRFIDSGSGANVDYSTISDHTIRILICINSGTQVTNKLFYPMIRLSTVTDATFEPYTNIASISGYDEVDINGCGENENDISKLAILYNSNNTRIRQNLSIFRVKKGDKVTISYNNNKLQAALAISSSVQTDLTRFPTTQYPDSDSGWQNSGYTYTCNYDGWISLGYRKNDNSTITVQDVIDANVKIELGSQATPYEPYTESNNISIQLDNTVYGGKLDVEKGELVVNYAMITLDGSDDEPTWSRHNYSGINAYYSSFNHGQKSYPDGQSGQFNMFKTGSVYYDSSGSKNGQAFVGSNTVQFRLDSITSASDVKTYLSTNNLQICYELATPTTIQLSPHAINLLKGVNTITTNGTSITLNYRNGEMATLEDVQSLTDLLMKLINNLNS